MQIENLVMGAFPDGHLEHLKSGGKLVFEATPLDPKFKPISLAFDLKHIYEVKILPTQSWINDEPIFDVPQGVTAEHIVHQVVRVLMMMSHLTGGAHITFTTVKNTTVPNN